MTDVPWTPGPWVWANADGSRSANAADHLRASGNRLAIEGRGHRAKANRAMLVEAPAMAMALQIIADGMPDARANHRFSTAQTLATAILARIKGATP